MLEPAIVDARCRPEHQEPTSDEVGMQETER